MRALSNQERKKRGCNYCNDVDAKKHGMVWKVECPFDECPYHALDNHKTYEEFMESDDGKILVTEFFSTKPSVFELASHHTCKRIYSDGDHKLDGF